MRKTLSFIGTIALVPLKVVFFTILTVLIVLLYWPIAFWHFIKAHSDPDDGLPQHF